MSKYINQSERVVIVGGIFSIPGGEAIELTSTQELEVAAHIAANELVKVPETITVDTNTDVDTDTSTKAKK